MRAAHPDCRIYDASLDRDARSAERDRARDGGPESPEGRNLRPISPSPKKPTRMSEAVSCLFPGAVSRRYPLLKRREGAQIELWGVRKVGKRSLCLPSCARICGTNRLNLPLL